MPTPPTYRAVSKEARAGLFSRLTFQWISPLLSLGRRRNLEKNDIWLLPPRRRVQPIKERVGVILSEKIAQRRRRPLLQTLFEVFKGEILKGACWQLLAAILQVVNPFLLKYLVQCGMPNSGNATCGIGRAVGIAIVMAVMLVVQSFAMNHALYKGMAVGGQSRAAMISLIFSKSMRLPGKSPEYQESTSKPQKKRNITNLWTGWHTRPPTLKTSNNINETPEGWDQGRIINLMSTDTYRVDQGAGMMHMIWAAPISVLLALVLLLVNISYSALAGFGFLVVAMPILGGTIDKSVKKRKTINELTDRRVGLTHEILKDIRFPKYFAWEGSFTARVMETRRKEIRAIQALLAVRNGMMAVSTAMPVLATILSISVLSLTNHEINPAAVFSSLALFNSLRMPLNYLPLVLGLVVDGLSSIGRIEQFLQTPEQEEGIVWEEKSQEAVILREASFSWAPFLPKPVRDTELESTVSDTGTTITGANFSLHRGELVALIGPTGAVKSSLLAALAGTMTKTGGFLALGGSRSFCSQDVWIQNASIRNNILFGASLDESWYNNVIDACGLRADLALFSQGDLTEVGERGITCSGGQKQRISIARAIYRRSDIILMDDPLSAVDATVGRHIMDHAICGLLRDRCRILATHQTWILDRCDRIICMENGRIVALDTYRNLKNSQYLTRVLMDGSLHDTLQDDEEVASSGESKVLLTEDQSTTRLNSGTAASQNEGRTLMQAEEQAAGQVASGVYAAYLKASGSYWVAPLVLGMLALAQGGNIMTGLWLSFWTQNKYEGQLSRGEYIGIYFALGVSQTVLNLLFSVTLSFFGAEASRTVFQKALASVVASPVSFFDTTPLGRIANRLSKDVDILDNMLTDSIRYFVLTFAMILSVIILTAVFFYYFVAAFVPLAVCFALLTRFYRPSARNIKRQESVLRSHLYAKFSEALSGISTIKAYGVESRFSNAIDDAVDDMNSAYFLTFANQRWLSVRLDMIGSMLVLVAGVLVATSRLSLPASTGGLVLAYLLAVTQLLTFGVRQLAEIENHMNSMERLQHYITNLDREEAPLEYGQAKMRDKWQIRGEIVFDSVDMRYRPGLPLSLRSFSLHIGAGERVAIVGRTGAGKSSIASTLFRLVGPSRGHIWIDGVDISAVRLQDLRQSLTIIPQDPVLFKGTIRSNLDPFQEHSDTKILSAITEVGLVAQGTAGARLTLNTAVDNDGANFSLGQRQLIALARAIVQDRRIVVCDEATSNVDVETDARIQRTLREHFAGRTLICIAHRLRTVLDYDRICVMDKGSIVELGAPLELFDADGTFRRLCEGSRIHRGDFAG
ncbi:ABC multidrug transporter, partial [Coniochaeta ligniaria NRRL 30616]